MNGRLSCLVEVVGEFILKEYRRSMSMLPPHILKQCLVRGDTMVECESWSEWALELAHYHLMKHASYIHTCT